MYAYYCPPLDGQPWLDIDDARLLDDYSWGCSLFIMSKRARRPEEEVLARLCLLGYSMEDQPKGKRIRSTTWTRRD
jgi:hypothetical protein